MSSKEYKVEVFDVHGDLQDNFKMQVDLEDLSACQFQVGEQSWQELRFNGTALEALQAADDKLQYLAQDIFDYYHTFIPMFSIKEVQR